MNAFIKTLLLSFFTSSLILPQLYAQDSSQSSPATSKLVPLFTLDDYNGNTISLESLRGKVVMINFWATWCPPCVKELPTMQALKQSFSDQPFEILAINMGENQDKINKFVERIGIEFNFPLLLDADSAVSDKYQVRGLPATMLITKQGTFAFGGVGERDWNSNAVKNEILPLFE